MARPDVAVGATYQPAERVLALLTSFDDSRAELGVTEMAALIGVHKSTASRLAAALERAGLLARSGDGSGLVAVAAAVFDGTGAVWPRCPCPARPTG